jgi:hypothetical protein
MQCVGADMFSIFNTPADDSIKQPIAIQGNRLLAKKLRKCCAMLEGVI